MTAAQYILIGIVLGWLIGMMADIFFMLAYFAEKNQSPYQQFIHRAGEE